MFILEDYERARARGAHIYAEIAGYGSTCEAFHRVRMSDSPEEPARAITLALEEASLAPEDIQYVNLHGTSTEMNDRVETRALKLALGEHARKIPMSGLKSQIGHAQGACGSASLAATLIAMEHGKIPPTINLDTPDPECDLDYVPDIGRKAQHRTRHLQLRRIWIEELGAGAEKNRVGAGTRRGGASPARRSKAPLVLYLAEPENLGELRSPARMGASGPTQADAPNLFHPRLFFPNLFRVSLIL